MKEAPTGPPPSTDPAGPILEHCRELVEDLTFRSVARWKADHPGALAIGTLPVYVPRPLLEAQGCLPVALFGGGDQLEIIRGDSFFQSYICQLPRSFVELGLRGHLDLLDGAVFPSTCDVIRNLSGVWHMLFPERWVAYLDLPQSFHPEIGGRFYQRELERIAGELAERGARPLEDDALIQAIVIENRRRRALADLDELRRREPWRLLGSEAYLAARAGGALTAREHLDLLAELTEALGQRQPRPYDNVRVVVVGAFCEQPPLPLIRALETAGCYLVEDDFQLGMRILEGEIVVADGEAPLAALARAYLEQGTATATRWVGDGEKGASLVAQVRRAEADGVIFASPSFCDPALLDRPMLEAALDAAGIPHTSFKYAENTAQFQVIREQAGAFSDAVKLWGVAS
jgi:benzoyl-CoA reductase subunit C